MAKKKEQCGNCRHWKHLGKSPIGHCWRFPPLPDGRPAAVDRPATTNVDDCCGEYKP